VVVVLAVIGRFPSGAIRTIGTLDVNSSGRGSIQPFGYWSLIDPDGELLDPETTKQIDVAIDFVGIEVI
jgi:hypothetical protein